MCSISGISLKAFKAFITGLICDVPETSRSSSTQMFKLFQFGTNATDAVTVWASHGLLQSLFFRVFCFFFCLRWQCGLFVLTTWTWIWTWTWMDQVDSVVSGICLRLDTVWHSSVYIILVCGFFGETSQWTRLHPHQFSITVRGLQFCDYYRSCKQDHLIHWALLHLHMWKNKKK